MTNITNFTAAFAVAPRANERAIAHAAHIAEIKGDGSELALNATMGKGAIKRDAAALLAYSAWAEVCAQFKRAGCTNVAPMARAIRAITGALVDSKTLNACPMTRTGFYDYPAHVAAWVELSKTERVKAQREQVLRKVRFIVESAQAMYDELQAETQRLQDEANDDAPPANTAPQTDAPAADASETGTVNADADPITA